MKRVNDSELLSRRSFLAGTTALAGSALFAGCDLGQNTTSTTTVPSDNGAHTLALIIANNKSDSFYTTMEIGAQARAKELGTHLILANPAIYDANLQIPIVEQMVTAKVDAIIIAACDKQKLIAPLKRAHDAGVLIISVDTFIGDGNYTNGPVTFPLSYIGSDNLAGGRIAGVSLIKSIGGIGKVYVQSTAPGTSSTEQRLQGFKDAVNATNGLVTMLGPDFNYHNIDTARAQTLTTLQHNNDIAGIFGTNDGSGQGASLGVKDAGKQGVVKVANYDATERGITDLRNGAINLLIAQKPGEMGRIAVEYAVSALNGNTANLQKRVRTGFVIIDRDNVDTPDAQAAIYRYS